MFSILKKISLIFIFFYFSVDLTQLQANKVDYFGSQYRDPLKSLLPKVPAEITKRTLNLDVQGIIWGGDTPNAIIKSEEESKVLGVGDTISGVKILDISEKGVLILFAGEKFLLKTGKVKKGEENK